MSTIEDEVNHAPTQENDALTGIESALTGILAPGSSLHPKFLAVLDGAFASLFVILILLAFLTSGNLHIFALIFIELCLWASVKWFVNELKNTRKETGGVVEGETKEKDD